RLASAQLDDELLDQVTWLAAGRLERKVGFEHQIERAFRTCIGAQQARAPPDLPEDWQMRHARVEHDRDLAQRRLHVAIADRETDNRTTARFINRRRRLANVLQRHDLFARNVERELLQSRPDAPQAGARRFEQRVDGVWLDVETLLLEVRFDPPAGV